MKKNFKTILKASALFLSIQFVITSCGQSESKNEKDPQENATTGDQNQEMQELDSTVSPKGGTVEIKTKGGTNLTDNKATEKGN